MPPLSLLTAANPIIMVHPENYFRSIAKLSATPDPCSSPTPNKTHKPHKLLPVCIKQLSIRQQSLLGTKQKTWPLIDFIALQI